MTTENGVPTPKALRSAINVMLERRVYLMARRDERQALGFPIRWAGREIEAINVTLPVLEAEWDYAERHHDERRSRELPERGKPYHEDVMA